MDDYYINDKKNNCYLLPSVLGNIKAEEEERELARIMARNYMALRNEGYISRGNKIALMASEVNGSGEYSLTDKEILDYVAKKFRKEFGYFRSEIFNSATSKDVKEVVQDAKFSNIFLIGHANYHDWAASDRGVNWVDLGKWAFEGGHLKSGVFANVGCGPIYSWNYIPLGYFVVSNHQNLFGYEAEEVWTDELINGPKLNRLKRMPNIEKLVREE